ncbi:MAG: PHP domain-containing protein [Clostridia bacterium]|nr:PHP domain-containing protein [Clostridia bacterium]
MIDLHVHTTASDGTLTPGELVALAREKGLRAVAITDHDTVDGVGEALEAGSRLGIEVIPGVEISVDHKGGEMHILGYYFNPQSPYLLEQLNLLQEYRNQRNPKMVDRLNQLGLKVTLEELEGEAGGKVIGRPHLASLMVKKGYVRTKQEAFDRYLATGKPAYFKKEKLTPAEGIELVTKAGGLAVLAHPKYLKEAAQPQQLAELLEELKGFGLKGIEAYYSAHKPKETACYLELAGKLGLVVTGGSDFHGANKPEINLGTGDGNLLIPDELLRGLKRNE